MPSRLHSMYWWSSQVCRRQLKLATGAGLHKVRRFRRRTNMYIPGTASFLTPAAALIDDCRKPVSGTAALRRFKVYDMYSCYTGLDQVFLGALVQQDGSANKNHLRTYSCSYSHTKSDPLYKLVILHLLVTASLNKLEPGLL